MSLLNKQARRSVFLKNINRNTFLNYITIADENYFYERYPDNKINDNLLNGDVDTVLDIYWRLLDNESKRFIKELEIIQWDDLKEYKISNDDPIVKLKHIISGSDEITAIMTTIFGIKSDSIPDPVATQKKKMMAADH